jgi:hypothetical protein
MAQNSSTKPPKPFFKLPANTLKEMFQIGAAIAEAERQATSAKAMMSKAGAKSSPRRDLPASDGARRGPSSHFR